MRHGLVRATLTLLAGGALAQALPLLLGPWLTRLYTPYQYGQFAMVWTLGANLAVVGCARYEFALPLARDESEAARLMGLCARVLVLVLTLAGLLGLLLWLWQDLALAWLLPVAVLAGAAPQWLMLWATRAQRFQRLALSRVLQYGGGALAQLGLGLLQWGALGLLVGAAGASLVAAALLGRPAPQGGWGALARQRWTELRPLALQHRDFPLLNTPHAFAGALQDSLSLWLLSQWSGESAAGYWALALRYLKAPAGLVGGALSQALYPRLAACADPEEARQLVRRSMALLLLLALPLLVGLLLWGPALFALAFGERWRDAGELARALAPYIALHFVAAPLSVVPLAWSAQGWALRLALVGQGLFLAGLLLGLQQGGLVGAAWGVSIAMTAYFGYFFWRLARWESVPVSAQTQGQGV